MPEQISRRETLRRGLAATSLLALVPDWATPALARQSARGSGPRHPLLRIVQQLLESHRDSHADCV